MIFSFHHELYIYQRTTLYNIKMCNKMALKFVHLRSYVESFMFYIQQVQFNVHGDVLQLSASLCNTFCTIYILVYHGRTYCFYLLNLILSCVIAVTDLLQQLYAVPRTCSFDSHCTLLLQQEAHRWESNWTQELNCSIIFLKRKQIYYLLYVFVQ